MLGGAVAMTALLYANRPLSQIAEPVYKPVSVDTARVSLQTVRIPVQAQGTVSPLQESAVIAEVSGLITEVAGNFNVGGFFSAGAVLLRVDPRDYQTQLLRAQSAEASALSNLAQEKGRAEVALREWEKLPVGSQRSREAKELYLRKPQLKQAEAQLLAAQADLNTARDNLERTVIRAPYDALIKAKHSDFGQFVSPGSELAYIFSVEAAEVRLPIPQSKLAYLELPGLDGYTTSASIDLYTGAGDNISHWTARLHRTEGVYDERSRVLYTVARLEDPYGLKNLDTEPLRIGTFVSANIEGKMQSDLVAVPRYILRADNHIWVIDKDLKLRNRKVSILRTGGDIAFISAGLDNGELISLTSVVPSLAGTRVEVVSTVDTRSFTAKARGPSPRTEYEPLASAVLEAP